MQRDGQSRVSRIKEETIFFSHSPEDTFRLGRKLGERALPGQVYTLNGDLGAGKTLFAQGMGVGLGVKEPVNSPTFTILQIYETGRLPLYHFDVYRIRDWEEMEETGWEDFIYGRGVCLVEWAEKIRELLPGERIEIFLERDPKKGPEERRITVREVGAD